MQNQKIFTVHPKTKAQVEALKAFMQALKIKFEVSKDKTYDPEFVAKIEESREQAMRGQTVQIDLDDIWKE